MIHDVQLIEKQVRPIELGRDSLKFLNAISIDQKTGSINRTRQRLTEFFKQDFD